MFIKAIKVVILLAFTMIVGVAIAQETNFFYIQEDGGELIYYGPERDIVIYEDMPTNIYLIGWNSSGRFFMDYTDYPLTGNPPHDTLLIFDLNTPESVPILTDFSVYSHRLVHFGANELLFTERTDNYLGDDTQGLSNIEMNVYEVDLTGFNWSEYDSVGSIPYGIGCGGGGVRNSLDSIYSEEVRGDTYGEYNQTMLAPTPYGIVHSSGCTAIRTLLTDPDTMNSVELGDNLRWANVSHSGEYVVGTMGNSFFAIPLDTLELELIYPADAPIVSSVWSYDSETIYFVTRTTSGESLPIDDPNNELLAEPSYDSFAPSQLDAQVWESALYQYDFTTDTLTALHSVEAYALGNLTIVDDALFFSQIETPLAWLQAYVDDPTSADSSLIERSYWLYDFNTGDVNQLEGDYAGAFIQPAP